MASTIRRTADKYWKPEWLQLSARLQGPPERHLISIVEIAADRQTRGDPGDTDAEWFQMTGQIKRCGLSLDRRVGGDYHLGGLPLGKAVEQLTHAQLLWADSVGRRDDTSQDVVQASELARTLDRCHIPWFLDDADDRGVALWISAHLAYLSLSEIETVWTEVDGPLHIKQGLGQAPSKLLFRAQNEIGDPLGRLGTNAGKLLEFFEQSRYGGCVSHFAPAT